MPYRSGCGSVAGAILALMAGTLLVGPASAQTGEPIKIGFSMALTGGLAPNGKSALLAQKLWEEDVNAKGALLGRPVKLGYYDDKSSPAEVPAIYTKLLDVDKVELVVGPYATAQIAPAVHEKCLQRAAARLTGDIGHPDAPATDGTDGSAETAQLVHAEATSDHVVLRIDHDGGKATCRLEDLAPSFLTRRAVELHHRLHAKKVV